MRKAVSLSICIYSFGVCLYSSSALSSVHCTNLVSDIKPNPTVKSKPASFNKFAGVYFISKDDASKFGSAGTDIKNDIQNCPAGQTWSAGSCQKNCNTAAFPYNDKPDTSKGNVVYDLCQGSLHFGYSSCNDGWELRNGECVAASCNGYNYTSAPSSTAGTVISCKSGDETKYKYSGCNSGWSLSNGVCKENTCSTTTYPYTSHPGNEAGTVISCQSGATTKYGYSSCNDGWDKTNGYCNMRTCTGYTGTSQTINGCKTVSSCKKGSSTVYKCDVCYTGYSSSNGACIKTCAYTATGLPANCTVASSCKLGSAGGEVTYYSGTCTTCKTGYTLSSGSCGANACTGYNSTSQTISGCRNTSSCQKGSSMVYKCDACYTGYSLGSGACTKTCTYTATGLPANCTAASGTCQLGSSSGEVTYYSGTCTTCKTGYDVDASTGLCKVKTYAVGDVYYYNDTPIGVVFSDDGTTIKIIGLNNIDKDGLEVKDMWGANAVMAWSIEGGVGSDYAYLVNHGTSDYSSEGTFVDIDGKSNTQNILTYIKTNGKTARAATATSLYAPSVCPEGSICGKGEWYLPSVGEFKKTIIKTPITYESLVDTALENVGGQKLGEPLFHDFWTSTECGDYGKVAAWRFRLYGSITGIERQQKYETYYVRPALEIKR